MYKKTIFLTLLLSIAVYGVFAQSRIFKEVAKQISSKVEPIMQDNNLVGYVLFTQLEQINKDSFSYKLDFMDENLNDIGSYSFKDINLEMQEVVFDKEVLLIGYLRTNMLKSVNLFNYKKTKNEIKSSIYFQFLNLNGQMIKEVSDPVMLLTYNTFGFDSKTTFNRMLKNQLRLQNIPNKGFVYTYGDGHEEMYIPNPNSSSTKPRFDTASKEVVGFFNFQGEKNWEKRLPEASSKKLEIRNTDSYIYLLRKTTSSAVDGGYQAFCIDIQNGDILKEIDLKDKKGCNFEVLQFSNDLKDNQPIISGTIINKKIEGNDLVNKKMAHTIKPKRIGTFTLKFQDTTATLHSNYWDKDSKKTFIRSDGWLSKTNTYVDITHSFSDIDGNVYFVGSGIIKKTRWLGISVAIATAPTILIPYNILASGIYKYKYSQLLLLKQSPSGQLSYYGNMKYDNSTFFPGQTVLWKTNGYAQKSYFSVNQNKFLVLNDVENIYIYNVETKNIIKTIPHQKGSIISNAYKAKDGFIMISEYNSNEKSTKLSIESL